MSKTARVITNIALILGIVALGFLGWYLLDGTYSNINQVKDSIDTSISALEEQVNTPGPLIESQDEINNLTIAGIIEETNEERLKKNLKPLSQNSKLNSSALVKVKDMFKNQYFAHQSPSGLGVGDLVDDEGYSYLIVGENLALGNFDGDKGVVEAWMDSPGHRANILKEGYQQIGVGVYQGEYKGEKVWMAVQHFGTPKAVCSPPNEDTKEQIQINNGKLEAMKDELELLEAQMEGTNSRDEYREIRREYNQLVSNYNALVEETSILSNQYNSQVNSYNSCLNSF